MAEFNFVSALIPFYRRVEMTALIGTAVVIGAVVGAVASLEDATKPNREVEAILLSLAPWVTVLLLLVQIMALTRIRRAALYIKNVLRPLVQQLTNKDGL
ncbi:MAG: hypothetical protein IIA90_08185, partial [Chloroflexi bacterium]|nr:hypothetical protein [Chloroflexota bacterium]